MVRAVLTSGKNEGIGGFWPSGQCINLTVSDPAVLSVLATFAILFFVWFWMRKFPTTPGAQWFNLAILAMGWWLTSTAMELSATTLDCKLFWAEMVWPGVAILPTAWAFFLYEYALARKVPGWARHFGLYLVPLLMSAGALTNSYHGGFYSLDAELVMRDGRVSLQYELGPLFYLCVAYIYALIVSASIITGAATWRASNAVRGFFYKLLKRNAIFFCC